jgi:hypothetical protein
MGVAYWKIINAGRGPIHEYENLKGKLYNCNASIYFNQQCSQKQLMPNYAKISYCIVSLNKTYDLLMA